MNQRRPKLGDILDDYCTRERRLTNHAVVAMVEDEVKLTRCTTCDTEHEFKHGKMPTLRRKKDAVSAAYKEVLAAVTGETNPWRRRLSPVIQEVAPPAPAGVQADKTPALAGDPGTGVAAATEARSAGAEEDGRGPPPPHPRDTAQAGEPRARPAGTRVHDASADRPRREVQGRGGARDGAAATAADGAAGSRAASREGRCSGGRQATGAVRRVTG